jgi:hypothetical protein
MKSFVEKVDESVGLKRTIWSLNYKIGVHHNPPMYSTETLE